MFLFVTQSMWVKKNRCAFCRDNEELISSFAMEILVLKSSRKIEANCTVIFDARSKHSSIFLRKRPNYRKSTRAHKRLFDYCYTKSMS